VHTKPSNAKPLPHSEEFEKRLVNESLFSPFRHTPDPSLRLDVLLKGRGATAWKSAGPQALDRVVAATQLLRIAVPMNFGGVERAWMTCLLGQVGLVFRERATDKIFLSLGFKEHVAMVWEMTHVAENFWSLLGVRENPCFVANYCVGDTTSSYIGVVSEVCVPGEVPMSCRGRGVLFRLGADEPLLRFALRHKTPLRVDDLKRICHARGVKPEPNEQGKVNKLELLTSLAASVMEPGPDLEIFLADEKETKQKPHLDETLGKALNALDPQVAKDFRDLQDQDANARAQVELDIAINKDLTRGAIFSPRVHVFCLAVVCVCFLCSRLSHVGTSAPGVVANLGTVCRCVALDVGEGMAASKQGQEKEEARRGPT
jgi:hypothetical protein